ncbi:hypothetical protein Pcinc_000297 [Petrolisthes cinctipes]|uniref:Uncharacterized protein n=1 Tax=Petrolisthes cinctipes TaxID=88211 RepID=A0AAE1GPZ3_PETCI|nr:hypothetical protein Pcinc_000297 [Petrolisthes cinctipes]
MKGTSEPHRTTEGGWGDRKALVSPGTRHVGQLGGTQGRHTLVPSLTTHRGALAGARAGPHGAGLQGVGRGGVRVQTGRHGVRGSSWKGKIEGGDEGESG